MKKAIVFAFVASLIATSLAASDPSTATAERKSVYPLFAFCYSDKGNSVLTADKITNPELIGQFLMVYSSPNETLEAIRAARTKIGAATKINVYMGGFTTNQGGQVLIDTKYRDAVAMTDVTTLAQAIDEKATELRVAIPADGELPILASTAEVSDQNDSSKYVFWIRIDNEWMKVKAVDAKTGTVTVERGFDNKPVARHDSGALVFTPVYLGIRRDTQANRHSNSWPGGPDYLRYALDPATDAAQQFRADRIIELMEKGYDGAWLDTFQPKPWNLCDALGKTVKYYWDFQHNKVYDVVTLVQAMETMVAGVKAKVKAQIGRDPDIYANSIGGKYWEGKPLFATSQHPELIDGYCFEDSYLSPEFEPLGGDKKNRRVTYVPVNADRWKDNVEAQIDAARSGLRALCMISAAAIATSSLSPKLKDYEQLIAYSYCSYLLTVTKERTTWFGLPLLIQPDGERFSIIPPPEIVYDPIGDPLENRKLEEMQVAGTHCYLRQFTKGLVVVRPSAQVSASSASKATTQAAVVTVPETVAIPDGYVDPRSGESVREVKLDATNGRLLLKRSDKDQ